MRNRSLFIPLVIASVLVMAGAASGATPKKPFTTNVKTCATYASPAFVKSMTGLTGTPQKGPNGQCHFVVNGQKDGFQVQIVVMKSAVQARAMLNQGYDQDVTSAGQNECPTTTDPSAACPLPQKISGFGDTALLWDTGSMGLDWFYVTRGPLFIGVQSSAPNAYVPAATQEAIAKHLLAVIPKSK